MKNSLSVDKRSILIDRHDVTFRPIRLTFRQELDWTVWLLRRARISCLEFYNCSVVNLVTVGYLLVTTCRVGLKGLMAPSCCVHQSDNGGYPAACDVSTLVRIAMTLLIYKKVVSVLNRVDDTRQFCTSYTWSWTGSSCRIEQSAINYHKRRLLHIYTLSPQTNI